MWQGNWAGLHLHAKRALAQRSNYIIQSLIGKACLVAVPLSESLSDPGVSSVLPGQVANHDARMPWSVTHPHE